MADATYIKTVSNNVFSVRIELVFDKTELVLMEKFGEPKVDFGGTFTGAITYTLPTNEKYIKSQLPVTQTFDGKTDTDAETKADLWLATVLTDTPSRIRTAITDLRAQTDTFTAENTITIT